MPAAPPLSVEKRAAEVQAGPGYHRRDPPRTLLYETVRAHLRTFLAEMDQAGDGGGLPRFVVREFERFLKCGILAHGFARVRCTSCGDELLVAFSCKGRGFCPSCSTRRMQGTAAFLVDRVIPQVPVRQWVLSLPRWARFLLARDPKLITRALDRTLREIGNLQRRRARKLGVRGAKLGAVTFVQRFGGALNLNVHFHCVVPDGVFARVDGAVKFVPLGAPKADEVEKLLARLVTRLERLLRPRREADAANATPPDVLTSVQQESVSTLLGKPADAAQHKRLTAYLNGFSLHAGVHIHANDRPGLAHLCGYGARPALTQDRLVRLPDGKLGYRLKRPLRDGRELLVLEPTELLRRLATLVPPPRAHVIRYHGVFGPASKWRSEVVPKLEEPVSAPAPCPRESLGAPPEQPQPEPERPPVQPTARIPWATLLLRTFREDVLSCPCGGRRAVIAFIDAPELVKKVLDHLGLPSTGPPIAPARHSVFAEQGTWQDDVPELQQSLR